MVGRWADVSRREADGGQVGRCLKEGEILIGEF